MSNLVVNSLVHQDFLLPLSILMVLTLKFLISYLSIQIAARFFTGQLFILNKLRQELNSQIRKLVVIHLVVTMAAVSGCMKEKPEKFVLVKGGTCINTKSNLYGKNLIIKDFYISKYEVTQKEWIEVMGYNPSKFKGDNLPVEMVNWYDCVEYCNKRSNKEGLKPYYTIDKNNIDPINKSEFDSIKWTVTVNMDANGYRLPTETEWEYAAGGGQMSKSFTYSGSNNLDEVGWYWRNSGDNFLTGPWIWAALEENNNKTKPIGSKNSNELNLFDMSGNVREWCEDWYVDIETTFGFYRSQRGGGWMGAEYRCESSNRHTFEASGKGPDQGFRVCRTPN
jgi:formylglycine-generating enzyme required for sulfatase activity